MSKIQTQTIGSIDGTYEIDVKDIQPSGSSRPSSPKVGQPFFDTTIGKPIWWNGTEWVDSTGTGI